MTALLFQPLHLGSVAVPNRIAIAPMCQYSAHDGVACDWHLQHLMTLGMSGAGTIILEATSVERAGRISHGDLGLYDDASEAGLKRALDAARRVAPEGTAWGVQLAHAGRKASAQRPWEGGGALQAHEDPWATWAPSPVPFDTGWHTPQALDLAGIDRIVALFAAAARRAKAIGLSVLEVHGAHGYLLHEFLSPLSNFRADDYGGSLENRMRLLRRVTAAVREEAGPELAVGVRLSAIDWHEGGLQLADTLRVVEALQAEGVDYVCASSGGAVQGTRIETGPGYQLPFAAAIKATTGMLTRGVGMITDVHQAEAALQNGQADQIAVARAILADPRWVWNAADALGVAQAVPPQYARARRPQPVRPAVAA